MTSQKQQETICDRMAGFLKALGLENKPEYSEKIPETLCDEDFHIHDTFHHGFPSHPSCLAYDPVQKILAIATKHGTVVLLGKPGLEGSFKHPETCSVFQMEFIANKSLLITSCDNRTLYQWSVAGKEPAIIHQLEFTKECPTTMSWTYGSEWLYVGNDAGNVHLVCVDDFTLSGYVIHWNDVVDGHNKMRPGDVMAVKEHPMDQGKILIAFSSSLLVLWNIKNKCCDKRYTYDPGVNHVLTSVSWLGSGKQFTSSYSDGTLAIWNPKVDKKPDEVFLVHEAVAGMRVSKIVYKLQVQMTDCDTWYICSGGYPEESHSCPKTITVRHGRSITLLSTNSTIVDFLSIPSTPFAMEPQKPLALVILTKDELVIHDLQTENFPLFPLPHALDLHMPPVSCLEYCGNCPEELTASLHSVKSKMLHNFTSTKPWPLMGGKWGQESPYLPTDLILTGHTDGSVRLWYTSSVIFQPFFSLPTTSYFKFHCTPFSFPATGSSSPTKKFKSPPTSATPQPTVNPDEPKFPPPRPPLPNIIKQSMSTSGVQTQETGEGKGILRQVQSENLMMTQHGRTSEESELGEREEEQDALRELERLKTPSPATGQLRVEGEEGTDRQTTEGASSPSRRVVYPREKKSIFKRHSRRKINVLDAPKLSPRHHPDNVSEKSPKLSPKHHPDNVSEKSDDRSESPNPEERKEKERSKRSKKLKSFRKVAIKVKIGRKLLSKGSSSEDGDVSPSEVGEGEDGEAVEEGVDERDDTTSRREEGGGDGQKNTETAFPGMKADQEGAPQRPESLGTQLMYHKSSGINFKKTSMSFRQPEKRNSSVITPSETHSKKSNQRNFERRISAPSNFRLSPGTPATSGKILTTDPPSDSPLTPIVEISTPSAVSDSVFATEEEVFAVQGIKCCKWGQWMCVSNAGGHVMAFSFQMDESVTTPKSIEVDFNHDTVLKCGSKCGNTSVSSERQTPFLGWALNERVSEKAPGFRLRQHVRCFGGPRGGGGGGGGGGGEDVDGENIPLAIHTVQYSMAIGLLAVGTNKGLAVIDTENNTVLHILSSLTSLLYMTNPAKFTRQVTRETTQLCLQMSRPIIQRHSTSWTLPHSLSNLGLPNSPARKPAATKTPTGKEGGGVGGADSAQKSSPTDEENQYTVVDCESSITALEIVQLPLDKQAQPTLTLWVGTASGYTVTYGIRQKEEEGQSRGGEGGREGRGKDTKKRTIQLMPTGLISEHKYPIVMLQFLNEWGDCQVVPYCISQNSSMKVDDSRRRSQRVDGMTEATAGSPKKENYVIIVDERKIKSYLFPGMTVINKAAAPVENTTLLSSQYFLCRDLPCLLTLTSSHHILVHSLPGLRQLTVHHYTPLLNYRVMSTFRVSGDGQALYMSSESEIQRLCVQKEDRLNLPHCLPSFQVAMPDPQPASKGKMDRLFGSFPAELDRASMFGVCAGQPGMSIAKRDGVAGAGRHHKSTRYRRKNREEERGEEERGRESGREEERGRGRGRGREEDRGRGRGREERTRRDAAGLSGQMNRNRKALEMRKEALTELEEKTVQLAGDADDFAALAEKLANKNRMKS